MQTGAGTSARPTVTLASIDRSDSEEIEEDNRLQAVPTKNSGKKEAEEVLSIYLRLVSDREAAITQLTNVIKESSNIKSDIQEGTPPSSQLISEQVKQLLKFKDNAVLCLDAIMATVCNLSQAIRVFKEK